MQENTDNFAAKDGVSCHVCMESICWTAGHSTHFVKLASNQQTQLSRPDFVSWFEACEIQGSKSIAFESPGHLVKRSEFS